jgi:thiamine-phosphate pyrophosphorylase
VNGTLRRARLARSRLYLVVEARPQGNDPSALLDAALRGGVDVVQLRDKTLRDDDLVRAAEPFRRACDTYGALFVLNDRPDLVEPAGADGVHVGQDDASLADARRTVGGERLVGLSASTREELGGDPDYFGVGAVYGTPTKPDAGAGGLELVRAARDTLRVPWFAIGGVDAHTIADVAGSGAYGVAVVRAIRDAEDPEAAARALRSVLPPTDAVVVRGEEVLLPQIEWLFGTWAPGQRPVAPHTHAAHTDLFYVLEGTMEFRLGDGTVRVPAGSCIAAPPLLVHGFRNPGDADAPFLNLHAPGVWARSRAHGLPPEDYDTFGQDRASANARPSVRAQHSHLDVLEYFVDGEYDGASLHVHLRHADCFHVLEGILEFRVDGVSVRAEVGTSVIVPPGVPHEFTSVGPARFLNVHAPSFGFVEYLRKVDAGERVDAAAHDVYPLPE